MFNKKTKKGFTIVELVIVIAVVAILAAVLIPTFAGLIKKAQISNDETLVRNLNTSLAISSEGGAGKSTMYETLEDMREQGYNVDKLTPTHSKNDIVWDSETNQFVLIYESGEMYTGTTVDPTSNKSKMWKVYKEMPKESEYSIYLAGTGSVETVNVNGVGFDAGNRETTVVNYSNTDSSKNVVLRTNGGELLVDAKNDTVSHYGESTSVEVKAVANESYHVYANILGTIVIESGHVQIENGANVGSMIIEKSSTETSLASVNVVNGSTVGTVVINSENAKLNVEQNAKVKKVAPGKDVTIDASNVSGVTVSTTPIDTSNASVFAGGLGTKDNPYLVANAEQLMYMNNGTIDGSSTTKRTYLKLISDIDLTNVAPQELTAQIPFKCYLGDSSTNGITYYFTIDGGDHDVYLAKDVSFIGDIRNSILKNVKLHMEGEASVSAVALAASATIENVSIYSKSKLSYDRNSSMFVGLMTAPSKTASLTIKNCKNYAVVENNSTSTGYNGLFIGAVNVNGFRGGYLNLTIDGFENNAVIKSGKISAIGNVYGSSGSIKFNIKNVKNNAEICSSYAPLNQYIACKNEKTKISSIKLDGITKTENDKFLNSYRISSAEEKTLSIVENADKTFTINKSSEANISYYVVSIAIYTNYKKSTTTGTDIYSISEKILASQLTNGTFVTSLKNLGFTTIQDGMQLKDFTSTTETEISHSASSNSDKVQTVEVNGELCYVVNIPYQSVEGIKYASNTMITVTAYTEDGSAISSVYMVK